MPENLELYVPNELARGLQRFEFRFDDDQFAGPAFRIRFGRDSQGTPVAQKIAHGGQDAYQLLQREVRTGRILVQRIGENEYPICLSRLIGYNPGIAENLGPLPPYAVFTYRRKSLTDLADELPLRPELFWPIADGLIMALCYLQAAQVVHRHIRMETVHWDGTTVQLADFAHAAGEWDVSPGAFGEAPWDSPEQRAGAASADCRDDSYAAALLLARLATGQEFADDEEAREAIARMDLTQQYLLRDATAEYRRDRPTAFELRKRRKLPDPLNPVLRASRGREREARARREAQYAADAESYYHDGWGGRTASEARREAQQEAARQVSAAERRAPGETGARADVGPTSGRSDADQLPSAIGDAPPRVPPGGGSASESDASEERFLVAQMPVRIPRSAQVSLLVRIAVGSSAVSASGAKLLKGLTLSPEGTRVTVVVQAPYELVPLAELEQVIIVPPSGDSAPVRFAFQAREAGLQRVLITAWAGGSFLAELGLEISVEEAGPYVDGPARVAALGTPRAEPGEVTLQVRTDGQRYVFQLLSQSCLFEPVLAEALTARPSQAVERTIATLRAIASDSSGYSDRNARIWMEQAGAGLWNDMVPELIKEQFWQLRNSIAAFSIAAGDDIIPWELLYPLARNHDEGFLVEQFPVVRRVYGQQRSGSFALGKTRYVVSLRSPTNAQHEIAAIRRILREEGTGEDVIGGLYGLINLIESGQCGPLHFACHNTFRPDDGGSAIAMDGGSFVPMLLNKAVMRRGLADHRPLVFINACRSAGRVPEYTRMMGWAQQFMAAGAGAFAGTLWAVRSDTARVFVEAFYAALAAGTPLGAACRHARIETSRDHGDPTWLAYSVYGDPAARAIMSESGTIGAGP